MAMQTCTKSEQDILRGASKNLPIGLWGSSFASLSPLDSEWESETKKVETLKEKVKDMLIESTKELTGNIEFINLLCLLGVSYHFEDEINKQLKHIFTILPKLLEENDYDLCILAILFRILREHGYKMTCDVFKKFKDSDGEFKESIINDVKGIICLYEACFLAVHGENILDEALSFTRKHLETLAKTSSPHVQTLIRNVLHLPSHQRKVTLHYISFYEADGSLTETLLNFAKLDFNRLQLLYKKELATLSKWWKDTNVVENLPYLRDRVVEAYMWAAGSIFEPQYSVARMIICKHVALEASLDDTYDTYGTIDELELFTAALERFTIDGIDELPEYMKIYYRFILKFFEQTGKDVGTEGCSYKASYTREMFKELARSYLVERKWQDGSRAPSFVEYMKNGLVTSTFDFVNAGFIQGMQNMGIKEMVWARNNPKIVIGTKFFGRLMNDVSAPKDETNREDNYKTLDCYMEEHGVSRNEAIEAILKILDEKWKDMNEDLVKPNTVPNIFIKHALNFARMSMIFYIGVDLYTYPTHMKDLIMSIIIKPLPI